MEYTWTTKFVKDLAIANRKVNDNTLWQVCSLEADHNKGETLVLYTMVKEELRRNHRTF